MSYPIFYCSNYETGGEHRLTAEFLKHYFQSYIILSRLHIFIVRDNVVKNKFKRTLVLKLPEYFNQFFEVIYFGFLLSRYGYIKGFINYCPLWNIFLWAIVDKNILIGPVSGQPYKYKLCDFKIKNIFGSIFLPILNFISLLLIKFRHLNVCSANYYVESMFKYFGINSYDFLSRFKNSYNFHYDLINRTSYTYDLVIYEHEHPTKNVLKLFNILYESGLDLRIATFGFHLNHPLSRKSFGYLDLKDLHLLLNSSKYYLTMSDEVGGIAAIDAELSGCICLCKSGSGASFYLSNCIQFDPFDFKDSLLHFLKNEYEK